MKKLTKASLIKLIKLFESEIEEYKIAITYAKKELLKYTKKKPSKAKKF